MKNNEFRISVILSCAITTISVIICAFFNTVCALICLALGTMLSVLFSLYTKKRYEKLSELNSYLSLVCSGNYSLEIEENTEGELSILKNNLYKVIVQLKTTNEMLERERTSLADSLADISHQLKTPLTSMMVMSDLLKEEKNEDKRSEFISIIESRLEKMNWLIQTLLKLSKLDAGTIELKSEETQIDEVIKSALEPFLITLELKEITVSKSITPFTFKGDLAWSSEAFQNIIKNCIEHTQNSGRLNIEAKDTNLYSEVSISDNGCGIEKDELCHIFERFYHGNNSSADSVGIGLALSKAIFAKQKAQIEAQSEVGKGTKFTVRFYKAIV